MAKHMTNQIKEVITSLKEQGVVSDDMHVTICKLLKELDHGIATRDHKQVSRVVEKLSRILWEMTR